MRLIDADKLSADMYHEAFEKDSDMQKWDSGCWIRYKMFENVLKAQPTVEPEVISKWKKEFREYVDSLDIARDDWKGIIEYIDELPSIQPDTTTHDSIPAETGKNDDDRTGGDCISRQAAIDAARDWYEGLIYGSFKGLEKRLRALPSAQPEKETAKRVLWTGWKGFRDTRYKCPNCKKPVKNDDVYCHRCGQKLMFPHISFTDYIPGEKQELIVRWDDE